MHDAAKRRWVFYLYKVQYAEAAFFLVVGDHGAQVEAREHVAVHHEERPGNVLFYVLNGAGSSERLVLDDVGYLHIEPRAVAKILRNRLRHVAGRQNHVADAGFI